MDAIEPLAQLESIGVEFGLKFLAAIICGGAIGLERESSGKPAGLRTNVLICLGAMVFTAVGLHIAEVHGGDRARIAAQIVTGIGFLGGGAILHERGKGITGMTTAALIWLTAAFGVLVGAGLIITAVVMTGATTVVMLVLRRVETYVNLLGALKYTFNIPSDERSQEKLEHLLSVFEGVVRNLDIRNIDGRVHVDLTFIGSSIERYEFLQRLYQIEGVRRRHFAAEEK
jgi:putative Mg2+ transporter-C (MgtC) family protein